MPTSDLEQRDAQLDAELAGLDALELAQGGRRPLPRRVWSAAWPKLAAIAIGVSSKLVRCPTSYRRAPGCSSSR